MKGHKDIEERVKSLMSAKLALKKASESSKGKAQSKMRTGSSIPMTRMVHLSSVQTRMIIPSSHPKPASKTLATPSVFTTLESSEGNLNTPLFYSDPEGDIDCCATCYNKWTSSAKSAVNLIPHNFQTRGADASVTICDFCSRDGLEFARTTATPMDREVTFYSDAAKDIDCCKPCYDRMSHTVKAAMGDFQAHTFRSRGCSPSTVSCDICSRKGTDWGPIFDLNGGAFASHP